jgi:NitT/TauT family transport system ATP-binding protein
VAAKTVLKLDKIGKSFTVSKKNVKVLSGIDLDIKKGEFSCIIGPNGCGKTTLAKIISGIENQSNGDYNSADQISYLPQQDSLLPWFTLRENIELPGRIKNGLNNATIISIDKYLKTYKLAKFANFYPSEISGGMKQKTALIRAIAYRPKIIVLDEPFSALDAITRLEMRRMLVDLWLEYRPTILCVTHDIDEAIYLSDRIFVMSRRPGKIIRTFNVAINRPRTLDDTNSSDALSLKRKLHELLLT